MTYPGKLECSGVNGSETFPMQRKEGRGVSLGIPQHLSFHPTHGTVTWRFNAVHAEVASHSCVPSPCWGAKGQAQERWRNLSWARGLRFAFNYRFNLKLSGFLLPEFLDDSRMSWQLFEWNQVIKQDVHFSFNQVGLAGWCAYQALFGLPFPNNTIYRCFLKWWYPQNTPKWSVFVGNHHINRSSPIRRVDIPYKNHRLDPPNERGEWLCIFASGSLGWISSSHYRHLRSRLILRFL